MAFTFQINNDLKFKHDEKLLAKAEANRPVIKKTEHRPVRIVDIVENPAWLGGWGPAESEKKIDRLPEYGCKRDDTLVLDFGDHMVGTFKIHIDQTGSPMDAPLYLRLKFAEMPEEIKTESGDYKGWLSRSWIQEEFIHRTEAVL